MQETEISRPASQEEIEPVSEVSEAALLANAPKPKPKKAVLKRVAPGGPRVMIDESLTPEQEAYCRARAMGMTMKEAAVAACGGISKEVISRWEKKEPAIQARIRELSTIASKNAILKTGLDRQWVISRLMTVADRCMQAEEVVDKRGEPTGEYKFDSIGATRALELLGKTLNMFDGGKGAMDDAYDNLSDDDLARIAAELAAKTGLLAHLARDQQEAGAGQIIEVQAVPETEALSQRGEEEA